MKWVRSVMDKVGEKCNVWSGWEVSVMGEKCDKCMSIIG